MVVRATQEDQSSRSPHAKRPLVIETSIRVTTSSCTSYHDHFQYQFWRMETRPTGARLVPVVALGPLPSALMHVLTRRSPRLKRESLCQYLVLMTVGTPRGLCESVQFDSARIDYVSICKASIISRFLTSTSTSTPTLRSFQFCIYLIPFTSSELLILLTDALLSLCITDKFCRERLSD